MRRFQDISEFSHSLDPFRTSVEGRRRPTGGNSTAARQIRRAAGLYFKRKWCAGRCSLGRTGRRPVLGSRLAVPEGASGSVGLKVAWQRGEKWLWQIVQVAPFPSFNMIRFSHFRLAAEPISNKPDIDIVPRRVLFEVHQAQETNVAYLHSCLFHDFPPGAALKRFHILEMTARPRPFSRAMRSLALPDEHFAVFQYHNSDSNFWARVVIIVLHKSVPRYEPSTP